MCIVIFLISVYICASSVIPLISESILMPGSCCFHYCSSIICLEIWNGDPSGRFHFCCFLNPMSFAFFQWNLRFCFQFLWRIELEFWWGLYRICRFCSINSGNHEQGRSFHFGETSSFSFFFQCLKVSSYKYFHFLVRFILRS